MSTLALIDRITNPHVVDAQIIDDPRADRAQLALLPVTPRVAVTVREATLADLPFIDALQKKHSKAVGWMPTMQLEGKIAKRQVLVAEERHEGTEARRHEGEETDPPSAFPSVPTCLRDSVPSPLSGLRLGAAAEASPKRERREKVHEKRKNDPALIAQARELRDRWLEHVAANPAAITSAGKYDVARQISIEPLEPSKLFAA